MLTSSRVVIAEFLSLQSLWRVVALCAACITGALCMQVRTSCRWRSARRVLGAADKRIHETYFTAHVTGVCRRPLESVVVPGFLARLSAGFECITVLVMHAPAGRVAVTKRRMGDGTAHPLGQPISLLAYSGAA